MKNSIVEKMRSVMAAYNEQVKSLNEKIAENNIRYSPKFSEIENLELKKQKNDRYEDAKLEITRLYEKVRELLAKASFPASNEITADADLLKNPYLHLEKRELEALATHYQDCGNYTMLRIISNWCEANNFDMKFSFPIDQVLAYKKLAEAALFTINGIHSEQKEHFIDLEIESFADPIMYRNELETIGDGGCMSQFEEKSVPDKILHTFDGISLDNAL